MSSKMLGNYALVLPPSTLDAQIKELRRELALRLHVYPLMVARRALDGNVATARNIALEGAIETLEAVKRTAPP